MNDFRDNLLPNDSILITSDWNDAPEFHNFEKELKKLGLAGHLPLGALSVVKIAHDNWCDIYNQDRCNCKPQILNVETGKVMNP